MKPQRVSGQPGLHETQERKERKRRRREGEIEIGTKRRGRKGRREDKIE